MDFKTTRRGFVIGSSTAVAGLAGTGLSTLAFGAPGDNTEILVVVFLRGGIDGLSLVPPLGGADRSYYTAARPNLAIPDSGPGAALDLDGDFGLHPAAEPLQDLYQDGRLAIVQATGMVDVVNKSHFDAMQFIELGTPGIKVGTTGWLTRHLQSAANLPADMVMPSLAVGDLQPISLLGSGQTVNLADPSGFDFDNGPWLWRNAQRSAVRAIYQGSSSWLHDAGVQALDAVDIVDLYVSDSYVPANGAVYPSTYFGDLLLVLAQMVKIDLGLQVATIDIGGWDTHESQAYFGSPSGGYFADLLAELALGLEAFYTDLDGPAGGFFNERLTVVVQSEFGRELAENADNGTEHGYGNLMMLLGGHVIGGLHGSWPGLAPGQLVDGTDLAVTTDYRQVLSEVLLRRMGNPFIDVVFPGYTGYEPLGFVQGDDPRIFKDGFESSGTGAWSQTVP